MRIGEAMLRNALLNRIATEEAIAACDPNDVRKREKLSLQWSRKNCRVQFISQMNAAEGAAE